MRDLNDPCLGCRIAEGAERPAGGVVARTDHFLVHGLAGPCAIPGWMVVTSVRHLRGWYDLEEAEAAALGALASRVMRIQRRILQAEHVYAFAIGDALLHFHLHLVPRYAGTPPRLRGRGAFDATPADALSAPILEEAAERIRAAFARIG